jgi:uroporphyrin-III C-methyltransferase/precorrin-2 dehydrogenase/sirohydrochlorin ferrochelatase
MFRPFSRPFFYGLCEPFQVVPGITAAAATSAYCGIPLTHRDYAQSVIFATGHLKDSELSLSWRALTQSRSTLVLYMALTNLRQIAVIGDLNDIADLAESNNIVSPAIVIVGEVVDLYGKLNATTA